MSEESKVLESMHKRYVDLRSHLGILEESITNLLDELCKDKFTKLGLIRSIDYGHEVYYEFLGFFSVEIYHTGYTLDDFTTFDVDEMCELVIKRIDGLTDFRSNIERTDEKLYSFLDSWYKIKG